MLKMLVACKISQTYFFCWLSRAWYSYGYYVNRCCSNGCSVIINFCRDGLSTAADMRAFASSLNNELRQDNYIIE